MTILTRISTYLHTLISKFLNEDDEAGACTLEGKLTSYLASELEQELVEGRWD